MYRDAVSVRFNAAPNFLPGAKVLLFSQQYITLNADIWVSEYQPFSRMVAA